MNKRRTQTQADCHRQETWTTDTGKTRHAVVNANRHEDGKINWNATAHADDSEERREENWTEDGWNSTDLVYEARRRRTNRQAKRRNRKARKIADALEWERWRDTHCWNDDDKYRIDEQSGESTTEEQRQEERDDRIEEHIWDRADRSDWEDMQAQAQNEWDRNHGLPERRNDDHDRWTSPIKEEQPEERKKREEHEKKYNEARQNEPTTADEEEERIDCRTDELRAEQANEPEIAKTLKEKAEREAKH